ncbi:hypothetical protein F5Y12DRAFT_762062 [Xylaria sp. FL1777]|nr:hypothetical protein F5Y12DRAFT_762062 [Xylaria sp. FL1777]
MKLFYTRPLQINIFLLRLRLLLLSKMRSQNFILFAPLAFASKEPRIRQAVSTNQGLFRNILTTCPSGYEICEYGCMHAGDNCCNDGTGYYCIPDSCCPIGEVCVGTLAILHAIPLKCPAVTIVCPLRAPVAVARNTTAPDFGICTSNGTCCDLGDDCKDSGSSLDSTSTSESIPISSVSAHDGNDSPTFIFFEPTSIIYGGSASASTTTAKTTGGILSFGSPGTTVLLRLRNPMLLLLSLPRQLPPPFHLSPPNLLATMRPLAASLPTSRLFLRCWATTIYKQPIYLPSYRVR